MYWYVIFERYVISVWQYSFSVYILLQNSCVLKVRNVACMCGHVSVQEPRNFKCK
jgi:hypothetical protein